ncbi:MAG: S26 family signal peptidase [Halobacteriales archaeon]
MTGEPPSKQLVSRLRWLLTTDDPRVRVGREILSSVALVLLIGLLLFGLSGVWPPLVAVESGSMEPHMQRGDLVFVMEADRLVPAAAIDETGIVPYQTGEGVGYRTFGDYGDVIVFDPPATGGPPIIHRARFWVDEGENWYDRAESQYINAPRCGETPRDGLRNCPAPHAGFITRGDANPVYDQASGVSRPVKPAWVKGTAEVRVPFLGYVRLKYSEYAASIMAPSGTTVSLNLPN